MILSLTTMHESDALIPLLAKEGPGVVDCWATTPYPLLLLRRGAIFMAARNLALFADQSEIPRSARNDRAFSKQSRMPLG